MVRHPTSHLDRLRQNLTPTFLCLKKYESIHFTQNSSNYLKRKQVSKMMNTTLTFGDYLLYYLPCNTRPLNIYILTSLLTFKHRTVLVVFRGLVTVSEIKYLFMSFAKAYNIPSYLLPASEIISH